MIKIDFHLHAREDKRDCIRHTAKELIDFLSERGYRAIAFTFHDQYYTNKETRAYAKKKGITLIPGSERTLEGAHILILNAKKEEVMNLRKIRDLEKVRRKDTLIIAAHPGFYINSLGKKRLEKNIKLFDAIEYSHFYTSWLNMNKKIIELAKKHKKAMVGNSDTHFLMQVGHTYSLVDSKKNDAGSIITAIKKGNVKVISNPLPLTTFLKINLYMLLTTPPKFLKRRKRVK